MEFKKMLIRVLVYGIILIPTTILIDSKGFCFLIGFYTFPIADYLSK
jgi:hypothetical protein